MNDATDQQLLRDYAQRQAQASFAELVRRHVDLVHSVARRLVVDAHLAEDVTQGVFVALARQAGGVARKLEDGVPLSGWLHVTARNLAAMTIRGEERRRAREQEAAAMHESSGHETDPVWEHIAPHLDHALAELPDADRDALLLRFFERRTAREIGARFGLSEEAAQKRVSRALERLRGVFVARGLAVPSASLAGALAVNAVQTAPTALAGAVTAGVAAAGGATVSNLGILQLMASAKLKLGAAALVAAGVATTVVLQRRENQRLQAELAAWRGAAAVSAANPAPTPSDTAPPDNRQLEELLRLRGEVAQLRLQAAELARVRAENQQQQAARSAKARSQEAEAAAVEEFQRLGLARLNYARNWGLAFLLYAEASQGMMPARLEDAAAHLPKDNDDDTGGLRPEQFEIVHQGSLKGLSDPARTILLREKEPFPNVGRPGWARTYLFADGHTEIHHSADGNFEPWERERMAAPSGEPR